MKSIIFDYWHNFDRTYFGKKWSADLICNVEKSLNKNTCDHTFKFTNEYFETQFIIKKIFQFWLHRYNCCDCEVLINLNWRDGLDWKNEPDSYKIDYSKKIIKYKDGIEVDLRFYNNGLKEGEILRSKKEISIETADGKILNTFVTGEKFRVLMKDPTIGNYGRIQLISLNSSNEIYNSICYEDDNEIFDELEIINSPKPETRQTT